MCYFSLFSSTLMKWIHTFDFLDMTLIASMQKFSPGKSSLKLFMWGCFTRVNVTSLRRKMIRVWGRKYNKRMMTCDTDKVQTDLTPRTDVALKFHSWMPLFCGADQNWIWTDRSITEHSLGHLWSNNNKKKYLKGLHHICNGRTESSHQVSGADGAIFFWWILDES